MADIDQPKTGRARRQTERLLNLLIALRSVSGWLDRDSLRAAIDDYRDKDDAAFDRMFNRDKKVLRELGIDISTTDWSDPFTGESAYGYRISDEDYLLPPIELSPEELSLLAAGVDVMRSSAMSNTAATAINKLRAQTPSADTATPPEAELDLGAVDDRYAELMDFLSEKRPVRFQYRKPGSAPQRRDVVGCCLLTRGKRTYLVGYDLDRRAQRAFRLSRILGRITALKDARKNEVPADFEVDPTLVGEGESSGAAPQTAVLRLAEGKGLPLRRRGSEKPDGTVEVEYTDLYLFAEELLAFGDSVSVVGPQELRDARAEAAQASFERLRRLQRREGADRG